MATNRRKKKMKKTKKRGGMNGHEKAERDKIFSKELENMIKQMENKEGFFYKRKNPTDEQRPNKLPDVVTPTPNGKSTVNAIRGKLYKLVTPSGSYIVKIDINELKMIIEYKLLNDLRIPVKPHRYLYYSSIDQFYLIEIVDL